MYGISGEGLDVAINLISKRLKNKKYEYNKSTQFMKWINKENYALVMENKSILLISRWIRKIDEEYRLFIPCNLCKLIHHFYREMNCGIEYHPMYKHKFYG